MRVTAFLGVSFNQLTNLVMAAQPSRRKWQIACRTGKWISTALEQKPGDLLVTERASLVKRSESLLAVLIHVNAVSHESFRSLVISPNNDAVQRIVAHRVGRVDVSEINVAEIRCLLYPFQY